MMNALLEEAGLLASRAPQGAPEADNGPMRGQIEIPDKNPFERFVMKTADAFSLSQLSTVLKVSLSDLRVAVCLHRVGRPPATCADPTQRQLYIEAEQLDALVDLLRCTRRPGDGKWLTISFDDGYDDAVQYVLSRAPIYPDIEWLCFVCPTLCEQRLAFPWEPKDTPCQLASLEALREAHGLPNVWLGNHTNRHHVQTALTPREVEQEYADAFADFARLFGAQAHFAFPFGSPEDTFDRSHVKVLRRLGAGLIWSTERRPYTALERRPSAVLPRFAIDCSWSLERNALWIAMLALKYRTSGSRFRY